MPLQKKPISPEAAKLRMAGLCSRSEQCEFDIAQKLYKTGLPKKDRDDILSYLKEERYIDNARFARSFAGDKCRFSSWGPYKIKKALYEKRIAPQDITSALSSIEPEEWKNALMKCAKSKARSLNLTGENGKKDKLKLFKYLISRGFTSEMAKKGVAIAIRN